MPNIINYLRGTLTPQTEDVIEKIIGQFGRYHLWLSALIFACKFPMAYHQMAIIFLAPKVEYKCEGVANVCPCDSPQYDTSIFTRTIIMEWDLICSRAWLANFSQTLFQLGTLLGSVFFGMASDKYGRRKPLLVAVVLEISAGIIAAYVLDYWTFTIFRLLTGVAVGGTMVVSFVILMEFVGKKYRDVLSALYQVPFTLGYLMLPLFGYYLRDYSDFQMAISCCATVLLIYFCFLPESPRWLIAVKRTDKAIKILEHTAKINKRPTGNIKSDVMAFQVSLEKTHLRKGNILDLFRTPNLRKNIIAMSFNWLTCSYCFYGVSQYVGQLGGNVFMNVAASALVSCLGTLISVPLIKVVGRKTILVVFNLLCGVCLLVLAVISDEVAKVVLACIGVVSSFLVFVVAYLYASELFPTVVRNAAVGFCSMLARVGSMIAPFVVGLNEYGHWVSPVCFAIVPLIAAMMALLLPETKGCELMTTIEEGENFGRKNATT